VVPVNREQSEALAETRRTDPHDILSPDPPFVAAALSSR
jgi:hypothetical protein